MRSGMPISAISQQREAYCRSSDLKPPEFWPDSPELWFGQIDCQWDLSNFNKFCHAVAVLKRDSLLLIAMAIVTPVGLWEFNRMPSVLPNAAGSVLLAAYGQTGGQRGLHFHLYG
jgi:hypothetical protein